MGLVSTESFSLLGWLESPRSASGLHVAEPNGGWSYTSYPDLADEVLRFAGVLRDADAEPGAVVALLATEVKSFVVAFMGTLAAGLTPAPVAPPRSYRTTDRYLGHLTRIFEVAEPAIVVTQAETHEAAVATLREVGGKATIVPAPSAKESAPLPEEPLAESVSRQGEELALLQFTSGSSGNPKAVRVSWGALTSNIVAITEWLGTRTEDAFASWLPLFHDMGLVGAMIMPVTTGTDLWIMTPEQFIRSPERWLECFGRHGATLTTAPSFGYAYCAKRVRPEQLEGSDFSAWRVAILGAERIDPVAVADFTSLVRPFGFDEGTLMAAYGLAEATLAVTGVRPGEASPLVRMQTGHADFAEQVSALGRGKLGYDRAEGNWLVGCGRPIGDLQVQILDEDGVSLPDGHFGQIAVTGSSLADGYLHGDGRISLFGSQLRTGDGGFRLSGELYVVGRVADSLKVRGATLFAEDLEAELARLAGLSAGRLVVLLGAVDGVDHAVLLVEDTTADGWLDRALNVLRASTANQVSLSVLLGRRGAIERTSSGKPRRRILWRALLDGTAVGWSPAFGAPPSPVGIQHSPGDAS